MKKGSHPQSAALRREINDEKRKKNGLCFVFRRRSGDSAPSRADRSRLHVTTAAAVALTSPAAAAATGPGRRFRVGARRADAQDGLSAEAPVSLHDRSVSSPSVLVPHALGRASATENSRAFAHLRLWRCWLPLSPNQARRFRASWKEWTFSRRCCARTSARDFSRTTLMASW